MSIWTRRSERSRDEPSAIHPADRDLGYLFVVTYGRSGSTLLQGLLNAIPGYLIRGENGDALHHLKNFHTEFFAEQERRNAKASRSPTHPFFGIGDASAEVSLAAIRRLALDVVLRPHADTRVTGFKEIRWYSPDLVDYVAWLRSVFPGARFVVNTRDHEAVLRSKWWAKGDNAAYLAELERRLLGLADELGDQAFRVHYDDVVADPASLVTLYDWLGEKFDLTEVAATLNVRHSM